MDTRWIAIIVVSLLMVIAACFAIYFCLRYDKTMQLNKCRYNLKDIKFIIDPVGDDDYILNFYYGEKVVHSKKFTESDIFNDKNLPYKEFVAWCESEEKDA